MNRYEYLLQQFQEGTGTEEEYLELIQLIQASIDRASRHGAGSASVGEEIGSYFEARVQHYDATGEATLHPTLQTLKAELEQKLAPKQPVFLHKSTPTILRWWSAAAALLVVFMVAGVWYTSFNEAQDPAITQEIVPTIYKGPDQVTLPDGTHVALNSGSELSFNGSFGAGTRDVHLKGEGFFDVQHDPAKPFRVHTGKVMTKVLGTAFNVRAYPGEEVKVTVARGLVEVSNDKKSYGNIKPDQQIVVNTETDDFVAQDIEAEKEIAWTEQYFILNGVTIKEAARLIGERFSVTITVASEKLQPCEVTTRFLNGEGLDEVLNVLTELYGASYTKEGNEITIHGGSCE